MAQPSQPSGGVEGVIAAGDQFRGGQVNPRHAVQGVVGVAGHRIGATVVTDIQSEHNERIRGGLHVPRQSPRCMIRHLREAAGGIGDRAHINIAELSPVARPC